MTKVNFHSTKLIWNISFILIGLIFFDYFFVLISLLTSIKLLPFVFPTALFVSVIASLYLGSKAGLTNFEKSGAVIISVSIMCMAFVLSAFYFDLSWDGQWYHQAAIYELKSGWNPIFEPIRKFNENNDLSIVHFPKGTWYYAASIYSTFGKFEAGKSLNFLVLASTILIVYATSIEFGLSKLKSLIVTILLALNPVIWSQITTYLVDGTLILYLTIYIATLFTCYKTTNTTVLFIGVMAIICLVNTKFTGLVFFCVFAAFAFFYVLFWKRELIFKYIILHFISLILAVFIFGFNPYITNTIERGHPLYPIMGTEKFPSVFEQTGRDDNELYETPNNIQGKGIITRLFYTQFGRPGNAPYNNTQNAVLMYPFSLKMSELSAYHYHETRVSGFGPFFSGVLILSLILFIWLLIDIKKSRWILIFSWLAIISTLFISKHFWWPRFAPHIWLLPILPIINSLFYSYSKVRNIYTWSVIGLLFLNGIIVLFVHMAWETRSSIHLFKQLAELKQNKTEIEINYGWFEKSMQEKLSAWDIKFTQIPIDSILKGKHQELKSVVEGYPGAVLFRAKVDKKK